jgi:hypothetical protein
MLLDINGKFTMGELDVELKSFKHMRYLHFYYHNNSKILNHFVCLASSFRMYGKT